MENGCAAQCRCYLLPNRCGYLLYFSLFVLLGTCFLFASRTPEMFYFLKETGRWKRHMASSEGDINAQWDNHWVKVSEPTLSELDRDFKLIICMCMYCVYTIHTYIHTYMDVCVCARVCCCDILKNLQKSRQNLFSRAVFNRNEAKVGLLTTECADSINVAKPQIEESWRKGSFWHNATCFFQAIKCSFSKPSMLLCRDGIQFGEPPVDQYIWLATSNMWR